MPLQMWNTYKIETNCYGPGTEYIKKTERIPLNPTKIRVLSLAKKPSKHNQPFYQQQIQSYVNQEHDREYCQRNKHGSTQFPFLQVLEALAKLLDKYRHFHLKNFFLKIVVENF